MYLDSRTHLFLVQKTARFIKLWFSTLTLCSKLSYLYGFSSTASETPGSGSLVSSFVSPVSGILLTEYRRLHQDYVLAFLVRMQQFQELYRGLGAPDSQKYFQFQRHPPKYLCFQVALLCL